MLCGALREKSKCVLIPMLCIVANMMLITSAKPTRNMWSKNVESVSNHLLAAPKLLRDKNERPPSEYTEVKLANSFEGSNLHLKQSGSMEPIDTLRRRKRSLQFELISDDGSVVPQGASKNMNEVFQSPSAGRKLYHTSTSTLLQILPDGNIMGTPKFSKYCKLILKGVGHVDNKTVVKIFGKYAGRYLAMTSKGILYTTKDARNKEINFLHEYDPNTHDAYISQNYRRYVTFSGRNGCSSPSRGRRVVPKGKTPKGSLFLVLDTPQSEKEEYPIAPHKVFPKCKKRRKKCRKRKGKPCRKNSRRRKHRRRGKAKKKAKHRKKRSDYDQKSFKARRQLRKTEASTPATTMNVT